MEKAWTGAFIFPEAGQLAVLALLTEAVLLLIHILTANLPVRFEPYPICVLIELG